jgi:hypothetical protein
VHTDGAKELAKVGALVFGGFRSFGSGK